MNSKIAFTKALFSVIGGSFYLAAACLCSAATAYEHSEESFDAGYRGGYDKGYEKGYDKGYEDGYCAHDD
jgi:hypothetical protein